MITDNSCYYFSNFTDPTQILTWNDAKQWCANKKFPAGAAKLVTLDNPNDGVSRLVDPSDDFKKFQWVNFKYRNKNNNKLYDIFAEINVHNSFLFQTITFWLPIFSWHNWLCIISFIVVFMLVCFKSHLERSYNCILRMLCFIYLVYWCLEMLLAIHSGRNACCWSHGPLFLDWTYQTDHWMGLVQSRYILITICVRITHVVDLVIYPIL